MASLMENLISVLEEECTEYTSLRELSLKKTPVIVAGDLQALQSVTDEEQIVVDRINHLENKRETTMRDIADVINKDVETLKLTFLIQMLEKRPAEQKKLAEVYDRLSEAVHTVQRINEQNRQLITGALEMVEFDLNLIQSMKSAPETANYTKGAYNDGSVIGTSQGGFDAKQ